MIFSILDKVDCTDEISRIMDADCRSWMEYTFTSAAELAGPGALIGTVSGFVLAVSIDDAL